MDRKSQLIAENDDHIDEIDDNMERYEFFSSIPGFLIGVEELVEKTKIEYEEGHVV